MTRWTGSVRWSFCRSLRGNWRGIFRAFMSIWRFMRLRCRCRDGWRSRVGLESTRPGWIGQRMRSRIIGEERRSDEFANCCLLSVGRVVVFDCCGGWGALWLGVVVGRAGGGSLCALGAVRAQELGGAVGDDLCVPVCSRRSVHSVGGGDVSAGPECAGVAQPAGCVRDVSDWCGLAGGVGEGVEADGGFGGLPELPEGDAGGARGCGERGCVPVALSGLRVDHVFSVYKAI